MTTHSSVRQERAEWVTESVILDFYARNPPDKSFSIGELSERIERSYTRTWSALSNLMDEGHIQVDHAKGRRLYYKLVRHPGNAPPGVELIYEGRPLTFLEYLRGIKAGSVDENALKDTITNFNYVLIKLHQLALSSDNESERKAGLEKLKTFAVEIASRVKVYHNFLDQILNNEYLWKPDTLENATLVGRPIDEIREAIL